LATEESQTNPLTLSPVNLFQTRAEYDQRTIVTYRAATTLTYLLLVITSVYYTFAYPHEGRYHRDTIWGQNARHHTPFALSAPLTTVYWIVLYTLQIPYLAALYPQTDAPAAHVKHACDAAVAFTAHNLLAFGFIHLWCRSYFGWALLLVIADFLLLTLAYFGLPRLPRFVHVAVLAGPLAFAFVALYWVGAVVVHARNFPARVVANVFVWTWAVYGGFYVVVFKDWAVGFALSALSACEILPLVEILGNVC